METALKIAKGDLTTKAEDERMKEKEMAEELLRLFTKGDVDGNRKLSESEFRALLESGQLGWYLQYIGIDPEWLHENLPLMFQKLAMDSSCNKDDTGEEIEIDMNFFVHRCMMLRGAARSTELMDLQDRVADMQQHMCEQTEKFELLMPKLSAKVSSGSIPHMCDRSSMMLRGSERSTDLVQLQDRVADMQLQIRKQTERLDLMISMLSSQACDRSAFASICRGAELRIGSM